MPTNSSMDVMLLMKRCETLNAGAVVLRKQGGGFEDNILTFVPKLFTAAFRPIKPKFRPVFSATSLFSNSLLACLAGANPDHSFH
jgi:hypothetical protein